MSQAQDLGFTIAIATTPARPEQWLLTTTKLSRDVFVGNDADVSTVLLLGGLLEHQLHKEIGFLLRFFHGHKLTSSSGISRIAAKESTLSMFIENKNAQATSLLGPG